MKNSMSSNYVPSEWAIKKFRGFEATLFELRKSTKKSIAPKIHLLVNFLTCISMKKNHNPS